MSISYICSKCGKPLAIIHGELVCLNCRTIEEAQKKQPIKETIENTPLSTDDESGE